MPLPRTYAKPTTLRLLPETVEAIDALSQRREKSQAEILREVIAAGLAALDTPPRHEHRHAA